MQILFLTSRLPYPPTRGDRLRAYHFIRHLAKDHEIHLVSFISSEEERAYLPELGPFCESIHVEQIPAWQSALAAAANFWRPLPLQALYYRSGAMQRTIHARTAAVRFDMVFIHLFRMAPYAQALQGLYRVVDLTDVVSHEIRQSLPYRQSLSRVLYALEVPRIQQYENALVRQFEETWVISQAGRQDLMRRNPDAHVRVIPNGVDTEQLRPLGRKPQPDSLVFVGHFGVFHNIDAAAYLVEEVFPLVEPRIPGCNIRLVGAEPAERVRKLGRHPAVRVSGYVPDLNAALNEARLFVAPLRFAAGIQNKVLEAMAAGLPVVTTSPVNQGLQAAPGEEIVIADESEAMADSIVELLQNPALCRLIGENGRRFVQNHFTWEAAAARIAAIAESIAGHHGPG